MATGIPRTPLPAVATALALAGVRTGQVVLDAGCGTGQLAYAAWAASGTGGRVVAVDSSEAVLAAARAVRSSDICWLRGDLRRLPVASAAVDRVIAGRLPVDAVGALAEWRRVLAPGGWLVSSLWGDLRPVAAEAAVTEAVREVGAEDVAEPPADALPGALAALLGAAGLRLRHQTAVPVTLSFPDAASYASWRLALPRAAAALAGRPKAVDAVTACITALLDGSPVDVESVVHSFAAGPLDAPPPA